MAKPALTRTPPVVTAAALLVVVGMVAALAAAQRPTTKPDDTKSAAPDPAKKQHRYAPTLAVLMAAYEGVQNKDDKTNPEAVAALKKVYERNPSAKKTLAKLHTSYTALSADEREKVVGKELAKATGQTKLSKKELEPITKKHFKKASAVQADKSPAAVRAEDMKAVAADDKSKEALEELKALPAEGKMIPFRARLIGAEPKEKHSTTYRVDYTGLYCQREPLDWGTHCEPAVVFLMRQAGNQWTRGFGPYDRIDAGDVKRDRQWLRGCSTLNNELTVTATLIEHDVGSLDEIEDAIDAAVEVVVGVVDTWVDVPDAISNAIADALVWIADVLGLTHDQIGESQTVTFTKRYAERHTGHSTWEGVEYDTFLRFRGNMSGPRRQRGDFYAFLDVREYTE